MLIESIMLTIVLLVSVALFLFSFLWVDKAIILMLESAYPIISRLLLIVEYGNTHREMLTWIWFGLITLLFVGQVVVLLGFRIKDVGSLKMWVILAVIALMSSLAYPLFSKDIFNYLFAGKTITEYHQNPYLVKPQVYLGKDLGVDFMANIDNDYRYFGLVDWKYAYGPVSIIYSLIPTILIGAKRFLWVMVGYKLLNWLVFLMCGWMIFKINKSDHKVLAYWFLSPLLLTELLTNAHNDLLMIFLDITALFIWQRRKVTSLLLFGLSVLTKFVSGWFCGQFLLKGNFLKTYFKLTGFAVLLYCTIVPKYPWYYSWTYMAFPFANLKKSTWFGLIILEYLVLITYYSGFLWLNRWTNLPFLPIWSNVGIRLGLTAIIIFNEAGLWQKLTQKLLKVGVR